MNELDEPSQTRFSLRQVFAGVTVHSIGWGTLIHAWRKLTGGEEELYIFSVVVLGAVLIRQMLVFLGASIVGVTPRLRRAFDDTLLTLTVTSLVVCLAPMLTPVALLTPLLRMLQRLVESRAG